MTKVHVLLKKEDIKTAEMEEGNKIAVVLDVLLATTTITAALMDGAKEVIPVESLEEGVRVASEFDVDHFILAGELHAKPVEGFVYPLPSYIRKVVKGKALILSTTNGTVALRKASLAKKVFIACLLNNPSVADAVLKSGKDQTVLVVCSGNSGELSLEDFYGAGHFVDCLVKGRETDVELSDSAKAAWHFYKGASKNPLKILAASKVGQLFYQFHFEDELEFASRVGSISLVPVLKDGKIVLHQPAINK
ncbi:2-phosphosulfolactate phosphatase [Sutcliffiella deserti]|uniref:2-phosphosulfolactate phosphatase n=1 Tax=Sutcliffiella deserti TaxID=2875501 RepID=UPI001CBB9EF5|nr:2-phosphosulfolactate phosphatase [Sutcliffiella deserti]